MKKLISLLAAVTITASSTTTVIACGGIPYIKKTDVKYNQDDINILLKQVSKAYYLNHNSTTKYDFNYVYENMVKNKFIQELDSSAQTSGENGINNYGRFSDIQRLYFGDQIINSKLADKSAIEISAGTAPKDPNIIMSISGIYPTIMSLLSNGKIIELVLYLADLGINIMPNNISDQGLLAYAAALLSDANIQKLSKALNPSKYKNYSIEQALNSSIIDFANALNVFSNRKERYKNSTAEEATKWRGPALNGVALAMQDLSKQSHMNLDIVDNWESLCGVINFVRIFAIYLSNFATSRIEAIGENTENAKTLTWKELTAIRVKKYSEITNELNIKDLIVYLNLAVNDKNGKELQNLLQFLFRGYEKYKQIDVIPPSIDGFISNFINHDYSEVGLSGVFKALLNGISNKEQPLGSMLVGGLGLLSANNKIVDLAGEIIIPPLISAALKAAVAIGTISQEIADMINNLVSEGVLSKPWDVAWNHLLNSLLDKQLKSGGTIDILNFPINGDNSIRTFMTKLSALVKTDANEPLKVNFNNVSSLVNQLQGVIKVAQENPTELLPKLGYIRPNDDNQEEYIKPGSFIDYLNKIVADTKGSNGLLEALNIKTELFKKQQSKLKAKMQAEFDKAQIIDVKEIDDKTFEYTINNEVITIKIDILKNKYSITAINSKSV
ncbi:lipoprotein [Mesoplasma melaleucae]|uniref:MOLPALP family lipoprotein n=1 Tax=Mesoplasma melaleucae TaxID=81459 RepID=A0A2K8NW02_9MOLU|nr:lipoprotein [Mesoplasma melaleucae]ATZ18012.1 hypothetical protein EMELA_v1c04690 [Mesoplasma melaleucae]